MPISLIKLDSKFLDRMLGIQIEECVKRVTYHQQVGFILEMQDCFTIQKPIV